MNRTVVGLFDTTDAANRAVRDLIDMGIARDQISVLAHEGEASRVVGSSGDGAASGAGIGAAAGGALGLLVGLGALAIPGIGPILAAGPLAAAIGTAAGAISGTALGAVGGAAVGGLLGALVDAGIPEEEAHLYAEGVRRGGTLVTASVPESTATQAHRIMERNGAADVNERAGDWRRAGWSRFDPEAEPFEQKWEESSKVGTTGGAIAGATTGAAIGSAGGPVGTVVGGAAGALVGAGVGAAGDAAGEGLEDSTFDPDTPAGADRYNRFGADFRNHYRSYHSTTGRPYETFEPSYRYGYTLASDPLYKSRDWSGVESEARRRWELQYPTPWDEIKENVRYAWDRVRGAR